MARGHGRFIARLGVLAGQPFDLGLCIVLRIAGVDVAVSNHRYRTYGPDYLTAARVDVRDAKTFVVKSRGHFLAGFAHLVDNDSILEVDAPGLTAPVLERFPVMRVLRPIWPLDEDAHWDAGGLDSRRVESDL